MRRTGTGAGGAVALGPPYDCVRVENMTLEEAEAAIRAQLRPILRNPEVSGQECLAYRPRRINVIRSDGDRSPGGLNRPTRSQVPGSGGRVWIPYSAQRIRCARGRRATKELAPSLAGP